MEIKRVVLVGEINNLQRFLLVAAALGRMLALARKRCWINDWVLDLDIKGFFDNIDHELMMPAVCWHTGEKWVLL